MRPIARPESPLSRKQIVDRVYDHFVRESNPRSVGDTGYCVYNGTGCAVGCMLTKEDAEQVERKFSEKTVTHLRAWWDGFEDYFSLDDESILRQLQSRHDHTSLEEFKAYVTGLKHGMEG